MKNLILSILLICGISSYAQSRSDFHMNEDASFTTSDGKDYIVINAEGKKQRELYNIVMKKATLAYNSAKDVISSVEGEVVNLSGKANNITYFRMIKTCPCGIDYVVKFQFKDGRIRVSAPVITGGYYMDGSGTFKMKDFIAKWGLFKNGELNPKKKDQVEPIEKYFNALIEDVTNVTSTAGEDW